MIVKIINFKQLNRLDNNPAKSIYFIYFYLKNTFSYLNSEDEGIIFLFLIKSFGLLSC